MPLELDYKGRFLLLEAQMPLGFFFIKCEEQPTNKFKIFKLIVTDYLRVFRIK
jgi:hypothetical protein